ncbi:MAG: hypothetical protein RLY78_2199 [Pseudomonadota bacterium]|jgi:predicted MFS family arabinose efflux permease
MRPDTESRRGRAALMAAHCAGMVDLVALPVWVGVLISHYGLAPQQAGGLATLFLAGAVLASLVVAPRLDRLPARALTALGYGLAALAFATISRLPAGLPMALLHALAGVAAGAALSITHGTIARSARPHRQFAAAGMALGLFAIVFLGATPPLVAAVGGPVLFIVFAGVMAVASLACLLAFPRPVADAAPAPARALTGAGPAVSAARPGRLSPAVWAGIVGVACMGLVQSMTFSFLERVGVERGWSGGAIQGVLVALGLVNLAPAVLAAVLERRWSARAVMCTGPVVQAALVAVIMTVPWFPAWAAAASVFAAVMIFTHTFAFGLLARLDASGRAMAATPAMLMTGAAIGPVLGGTLVQTAGYASLAVAAAGFGALAVACFARVPQSRATGAAALRHAA